MKEVDSVGIEALNFYAGRAKLDVSDLARTRGLDMRRFENLLLHEKSVALNFEDPVSFAVNAAKPLVDALSLEEKQSIELLVVATESGLDFGKPVSSYVHDYLQLSRHCRNFEVKHACYGGTAALTVATNVVRANPFPNKKALVIATDVARPIPHTYAEPSQGAAAVAMLISDRPTVLSIDIGANGFYGYEVMDSCRPTPEIETGDADLSLLSYLDCLEHSFQHYQERVSDVDFQDTFGYLAFHTPFGGLVKGAHRAMMRKLKHVPPAEVDEDFRKRLEPSLHYPQQIGNVYSGSLYLSLAGVIQLGQYPHPKRIGLFSYGSGCCSEFFSGVSDAGSQAAITDMQIGLDLQTRHPLSMEEYEQLIKLNRDAMFGVRDAKIDSKCLADVYREQFEDRGLLFLKQVSHYHREYDWS